MMKKFKRKDVKRAINHICKYIHMIPVGGWRRGKQEMKDIDFLTSKSLSYVVKKLSKINIVRLPSNIDKERRKFDFKYKINNRWIKVDVFRYKKGELPFAMLQYTGSKEFNIAMRVHAKKRNLKLNQYGLFRGDKKVLGIKTERDIFKKLKFTWHAPIDR